MTLQENFKYVLKLRGNFRKSRRSKILYKKFAIQDSSTKKKSPLKFKLKLSVSSLVCTLAQKLCRKQNQPWHYKGILLLSNQHNLLVQTTIKVIFSLEHKKILPFLIHCQLNYCFSFVGGENIQMTLRTCTMNANNGLLALLIRKTC